MSEPLCPRCGKTLVQPYGPLGYVGESWWCRCHPGYVQYFPATQTRTEPTMTGMHQHEIASLQARIRDLERDKRALEQDCASLDARVRDLEAALATANQLLNEVKISSSEARRAGAEAFGRWAWSVDWSEIGGNKEIFIRTGIDAVCARVSNE